MENTSAGGAPAVEKICAQKRFTRVSQFFIAQYYYKYLCYNNIYFMTPYRKMHHFIIEPRDSSINCCCIATMQSVVTGQTPITLERKITSGGKQIKIYTNRIPRIEIVYLRQKYKGEISARTSQDTC